MLGSFVRGALIVVGLLSMLGGLAILGSGDAIGGLWAVGTGGALVVLAVIERHRYRSATAERSGATPGPGGGETADSVDARFRRTDEVFVDPTSGRRMRVLVDPSTGERRYVAEA